MTNITDYKFWNDPTIPTLKKIYQSAVDIWIIKTELGGRTILTKVDLTLAPNGLYQPATGHQNSVYRANVNPNAKSISVVGNTDGAFESHTDTNENETYPHYIYTAAGETETEETDTPTDATWILSKATTDISQKTRIAIDWRNRIHRLAVFFEENDRAWKWAHEDEGGDIISLTLAERGANHVRLQNTSRHWGPKGIGLAWRTVSKYLDAASVTLGTPVAVRTDPNDIDTAVTLNLTTGAGIEELIKALEDEYRIEAFVNESLNNPILTWHYAAGNEANRATWQTYYTNRQWWFTNYSTASGAYILYTAADAADWADLYEEYTHARDYQPVAIV